MVTIVSYDDNRHRQPVIELWKSVFGYEDPRNDPARSIDKKLSVKDGLIFVAKENDKVLGTIMAGYDGHRGWIYSLAVIPEKRNLKIGTKLLEHAEHKLRELGCVKINLQIMGSNESVKQFYVKNGYAVEERISMGKVLHENVCTTPVKF
jgi:ribosomal protein S18 acetylase RimI-like enzyme